MDMCSKERCEAIEVCHTSNSNTTSIKPPPKPMLRECQETMSDTILGLEHQQYEIYSMINEITIKLVSLPENNVKMTKVDNVEGHRERLAKLKFKNLDIMDMLADIIQVL